MAEREPGSDDCEGSSEPGNPGTGETVPGDGGKDPGDGGRYSGGGDDGPPQGGGYRWITDPGLQRERLAIQVDLILRSIDGAAVYPPDKPGEMEYLYVDGRILVRDTDLERVQSVVEGEVIDSLVNGLTVFAPANVDTLTALQTIDAQLGTGVATPDHIFYVSPSVCCPADEPTPHDLGQPDPAVAARGYGDGDGSLVAVVDTGFISGLADSDHPWLQGVTGDEEHFDADAIGPYVGHGTFVAGVVRTMAPASNVRVEGILTEGGAVTESRILLGLHAALEDMPDVISMSAGCTTRHDLPPLAFEVFWERRLRHTKGTVLVVAAGNNGWRRPFWPAAFPWTVSVGATTRAGARAPFSNFGSWVDVYALGVDMVNAYPNGRFPYHEPPRRGDVGEFRGGMATWSGTSFSTPLLAGMIAARISVTGQNGVQAAASLLRIAQLNAVPGIGAVAEPAMTYQPDPSGP